MIQPGQNFLARTGRSVERLAMGVAILGGMALILIALITLVSVAGRALIPIGLKPLRGQFELVEVGTAFAICAFLPWAHLKRGHASVAIFTDYLSHRTNLVIDFIGDVLLFGLASLMTWRHLFGMFDKISYGQTTYLLGLPLWWAYATCLVGLVAWIIVGFWSSLNSASQLFARPPTVLRGSANHK